MKIKTILKHLQSIRTDYNSDDNGDTRRELCNKIGNMNLLLYGLIEKLKKQKGDGE